MKKSKILFSLAIALMLSLAICFGTSCDGGTESTPGDSVTGDPVISVTGVPTSGIIGREVTLPAATAKDSAGADVSASVKLTVAGCKEDGTVGREFIYREAANVSRKFTPTAQFVNYSIVYELKDSYGKTDKKEFAFVAEADNLKPVITVTEEGYNAENGIKGDSLNGFVLPDISVIDQPGDVDVTAGATYAIMNGDVEVSAEKAYVAGKKVFIAAAGNYTLVIKAKDSAGNAADPLSVAVGYEEKAQTGINLIDEDRVVVGKDAYINEYGELCVGASAKGGHSDPNDSASYATLGGISVKYGQLVALSVNMDVQPAEAYNWFFQIGLSLNQTSLVPAGNECVWPDFEVRFFNDKTQVHGTGNDIAAYYQTAKSLRDGKDHTIYFNLSRNGSGPEDPNANLCICMWIDDVNNAAIFTTVSVAGVSGLGIMSQEAFTRAWNNETHYLMFGAVSFNGPAEKVNDVMTVKSVVVQSADKATPDTSCDIVAPAVTVNGEIRKAYDLNEKMNLPEATADGNETVEIYLTDVNGKRVKIEKDHVPTVKGSYKLSFVAKDAAGNYGYAEYDVKVLNKDTVAPVLTVSDKKDIAANVGEAFAVPAATASDNIDGDLTSSVIVNVLGAAWAKDIGAGKIPETYTIMAAGVHYLEYVVSDEYGNETRETVKVNVGGSVTGDVLPDVVGYDTEKKLLNLYNSSMTYANQQILNERVSTILNFKTLGNFEINLAGPRGTVDGYAQGIMMRIFANRIEIRVNGNNGFRIGYSEASPFASYDKDGNLVASGKDVVLDWQITEETLTSNYGTYDVLRFRVWIDGTELQMAVSQSYGWVYADLAGDKNDGGYGICLIKETAADDANAQYALENAMKCSHLYQASELYMASTFDTNVDIKGIRFDGKSFADAE